jgi:hypothetical protein
MEDNGRCRTLLRLELVGSSFEHLNFALVDLKTCNRETLPDIQPRERQSYIAQTDHANSHGP